MKIKGLFIVLAVILITLGSCVSISTKEMGGWERANGKIVGKVTTTFTAFRSLHFIGNRSIETRAYRELVEKAQKEFGPNADVRNVEIEGSFSGWEIFHLLVGAGAIIPGVIGIAEWGGFAGPSIAISLISFGSGWTIAGHYQKINAIGDVVLYETKD
jgi:hypothetical protein